MITLTLSKSGNPQSHLPSVLRAIPQLNPPVGGGSHIYQVLMVKWRKVYVSLNRFIQELDSIRDDFTSEKLSSEYVDLFLSFIYDSTELFDVYNQLIPSQVDKLVSKDKLKDYKAASKRLRSSCAELCNTSKHATRDFAPIRIHCLSRGIVSNRFIVRKHVAPTSLLRDEKFHGDLHHGACPVTWSIETIHRLLRCDHAAYKLLSDAVEIAEPSSYYKESGDIISKLLSYPPCYVFEGESLIDGISIRDGNLILERVKSTQIKGPIKGASQALFDGIIDSIHFV